MKDLNQNILNFQRRLPSNIKFIKLSSRTELLEAIGFKGNEGLSNIPKEVFDRIIERGKKFYELFDWNEEQILKRSKIIASSEAFVGDWLRDAFPSGIMVYTPTMLERGAVYSGMKWETDPLPIIFPKHE